MCVPYPRVTARFLSFDDSSDDHGRVAGDLTATAVDKLRQALQKCNYEEFQNPRDPTSINLRKAFMSFDTQR